MINWKMKVKCSYFGPGQGLTHGTWPKFGKSIIVSMLVTIQTRSI